MARIQRGLRAALAWVAQHIDRDKDAQIAYLLCENRILKQQLGGRRVRLGDEQRIELATCAKALGRSILERLATIVTPDTLLRWHRQLVAKKQARHRRTSELRQQRVEAVLRFARENPSWGTRRIQGALRGIGIRVSRSTVLRILREYDVPPATERKMPWRAFVRAHAASMVAADFFTAEVWTARGLVTHYVLFAIDVGSRAVRILGVTPHPNRRFVEAVARALIDPVLGFLSGKSFFLIDGDKKFTRAFREIIEAAGVHVIRTAWRSPNMNAHAERFVRSVKSECLRHFVLVGSGQLERVLREYVAHYNAERHHQGIGNRLIAGLPEPESPAKRIATTRRLGGLLSYYHPAAAA